MGGGVGAKRKCPNDVVGGRKSICLSPLMYLVENFTFCAE